jgi:hypothetical protein
MDTPEETILEEFEPAQVTVKVRAVIKTSIVDWYEDEGRKVTKKEFARCAFIVEAGKDAIEMSEAFSPFIGPPAGIFR